MKQLKSVSFVQTQSTNEVLSGIANNVVSHSILDASKDGFRNSTLTKIIKSKKKRRLSTKKKKTLEIKIMATEVRMSMKTVEKQLKQERRK